MVGRRRARVFSTALIALILVSATQAVNTDIINFNFYPTGSQDCLYTAADASRCESATVVASNSCLCRNGGNFITLAAACIGKVSRGDLTSVYTKMTGACKDSNTPIGITETEFINAANAATSSSSMVTSTTASATASTASSATASTTSSATASSTSSGTAAAATTTPPGDEPDEQKSSGLSSAAMAGLIVGASVGGLALIGGIAWFIFRRRRKSGEESHPMLPQYGHASLVSSGQYGSPPDTGGFPKKDWTHASSDNRSSAFNWESPNDLSYQSSDQDQQVAYKPNAVFVPEPIVAQELDAAVHHPTGTAEAPAEMGGTPIATTAPPHAQFQPYRPGQPQADLGLHPSQR